MLSESRRMFLKRTGAVALGFAGLQASHASGRVASIAGRTGRYGPLRSDPQGIFDLPRGFEYEVISRVGNRMADGLRVPGLPDGMAAFPGPDGSTLIVRNHELSYGHEQSPFVDGKVPAEIRESVWDHGSGQPLAGGTTTIMYDTKNARMISEHLSLAGTERNCAGGPTPRNSWITCEETVSLSEDGKRERNHGFCFEVPARALGDRLYDVVKPEAIYDMGRFNHEACATSPSTGIVYQTEDAHDGLIYRYKPRNPDVLTEGGVLQALVIEGRPALDTRNWPESGATVRVGERLGVTWMDMDNVLAPKDDLRIRGFARGAAKFARGEGMWMGTTQQAGRTVPTVFFACTNGGSAKAGQIWKLHLPGDESEWNDQAGELELFVEPNDRSVIEHADNIAQSPWGDLFVCEDGGGSQYLLSITPEGDVHQFGRNAMSESELAGVCFSPDGSTMFVNIQHDGLTLAIRGPWA